MMLRIIASVLTLLLLSACGQQTAEEQSAKAAADIGSYPQRPVKVIIPFGPGGLADVTVRLAAEALGERIGQNLVIENRPGAGGVAATTSMLNAEADGHTLIILTNGTTIAESQFPDLPYDINTDLQPVSALTWFDLVLLTSKDSGIADMQQLLARAQESEQGLKIATINPGSTQHLSANLFKSSAGINATIITYRTTPDVLGALLRNEVDLVIDSYTALKGAIDNGDAIALAVTGEQRNVALPMVPTTVEAGVENYVVTGWNALYTHAQVPVEIINKLNAAMMEVAALPEIRSRFQELGVEARASAPEEIQQRLRDDVVRWRQVMQETGLIQ